MTDVITTALAYVGTLDNASGQVCQLKDGKPHMILFDLGCNACSEVASKNADEFAAALVLVVNSTPILVEEVTRLRAVLMRLIGVDSKEELQAMEAMIRIAPAPAEDKAAMIDAIHVLLKSY